MRRLLPLAVGLVVLAGCATVPAGSSPVVVTTVDPDSPADTVAAPLTGREPDLLVCDFVSASTSSADGHAAARAYLTPEAARTWEDTASTTVVDNVDCLPDDADAASSERAGVLLRGDVVGTLSTTGQFVVDPAPRAYTARLSLVQVDGQWRIDDPPAGVVLREAEFQDAFRRLPVYFLTPGLDAVVPDPRWLVEDPDSLAARLVDLVLKGPSGDLAGAVVTQLGVGASLLSNVVPADPSGAPATTGGQGVRVDLGGLAELDVAQRRLLAAQLVWTLDAASVAGPYFLLADGVPLDPAQADGWTTADVVSTDPAAYPGASVGLHSVLGGALVRLAGDGEAPVPVAGALGEASAVQSAALSRDGERVAAVVSGASGGVELRVGATRGAVVTAAEGTTMTRPTWSSDGAAAWVVQNGTNVLLVTQDEQTGAASTQQVDVSALGAAPGAITALRLSRDGVRAGLVVGGTVLVSTVVRTDAGTVALTAPRAVAPSLGATVVTLDWAGADTLLLARTDVDRPVLTVTVDGSEVVVLPGNNLSAPVRAVASSPTEQLVADSRGVLQLSSGETTGERTWRPVSGLGGEAGASAVPLLPG